MKSDELIDIAVIGKCVGLKGELKLHLKTDFPEQFKKNSTFYIDKDQKLKIEYFNENRSLVKFIDYNSREDSTKLINKVLKTTIKESKKNCHLKEGEFFWFDLIGVTIMEENIKLGVVKELERIADINYLIVLTDKKLLDGKKLPKQFYIPYIDRYIEKFDIDEKMIYVKDAYDLLEAS